MNGPTIEMQFLGTGTSAGVPMIGCRCPVCTSTDPHDKRDRCSVVFRYGQTQVLVDTTPELRRQAVRFGIERIDALVYTHAHADHIMGLDDVRRFNTERGGPLDCFADERAMGTLQRIFAYAFREPEHEAGVYRPHLLPRVVSGPFAIGGVTWTPLPLMHGKLPILGYRVGDIAYCTDVSHVPEETFDLLRGRGLDVLVLDALRHRRHPTHLSLEQAVETAERIGAKRTFFTHIAHDLPHAATNASLPADKQLAHDGLLVRQ